MKVGSLVLLSENKDTIFFSSFLSEAHEGCKLFARGRREEVACTDQGNLGHMKATNMLQIIPTIFNFNDNEPSVGGHLLNNFSPAKPV